MIIVRTSQKLSKELESYLNKGVSTGFVPTMGALHEGHLSLVRCSLSKDQITVVSIFVNPTQFNDPEDLKKYPRDPETDFSLLEKNLRTGDIVFYPDEQEIYPEPDHRVFNFGMLDKVMEGKFRPGHFNGVAQVVSKLFDMVKPENAYFGLKDFQQLVIIRHLVKILGLPVRIIPCPIIREPDGLAMSSRNIRLGKTEREQAPLIYKSLSEALRLKEKYSVKELTRWVINKIQKSPSLKVEYFEIVNADTLQPVTSWDVPGKKQGCIAVWAGEIRLIDNIPFNADEVKKV